MPVKATQMMWPNKVVLILAMVVVLFLELPLYAQEVPQEEENEEAPLKIEYLRGDEVGQNDAQYTPIDTSLESFHTFKPGLESFPENINGPAIGHNLFSLTKRSAKTKPGFQHGFDQYEPYRYTFDNTKFYDTYTPFSEVNYVQGQETVQFGRGSYSRNFRPNLNVGFDVERHRSEGSYFNQQILHTKGRLYGSYQSLNRRYQAYFSGNWNRFNIEKNGGIAHEQEFMDALPGDRVRTNVNLRQANSEWDDKNINLYQSYTLGEAIKDTSYEDDTTWVTDLYPEWKVFLENRYKNYHLSYQDQDPDPAFYPNSLAGGTPDQLNDSVKGNSLFTEVGFKSGPYSGGENGEMGERFWYLEASLKHWFDDHRQHPFDRKFNNWGGSFKAELEQKPLKLGLKGTYVYDGILSGESLFNPYFEWDAPGRLFLNAEGEFSSLYPALNREVFDSRGYFWSNDFDPIQTNAFSVEAGFGDLLKWEGTIENLTDYVYFDETGEPAQTEEPFTFFRTSVESNLSWEGFNLRLNAGYQHTGNNDALRIPDFFTKTALFYERELFDDELLARLGTEAMMFSSHASATYMPFAGGMRNVNDGREIGGYPFLNAFFTARIAKVRLFARYDHFNANLMNGDYFLKRNYPHQQRSFRFGINWLFYD